MPDYKNSKIYKIVSYDNDEIYIGSTTESLSKRFHKHKHDLKRFKAGNYHYITSFKILEYETAHIVLIENFPCENKEELFKREQYHIQNNKCVNKFLPIFSRKEYYEKNKDKINEKRRLNYKLKKDSQTKDSEKNEDNEKSLENI
jgi:hypothetical protein